MLTYEKVVNSLLDQIRSSDLIAYNIKNQIETHTLEKEFRCNCVLVESSPPHISRVELSFAWDSHLTAASVYGSDCSLYHDDTIDCIHDSDELDASIELEIEYNIEVEKGFENESQTIYKELTKVFNRNMNHGNIPSITWKVTINNAGKTFISSITAEHYWEIDINETELDTEQDFEGILDEIAANIHSIEQLPFIKKKY